MLPGIGLGAHSEYLILSRNILFDEVKQFA